MTSPGSHRQAAPDYLTFVEAAAKERILTMLMTSTDRARQIEMCDLETALEDMVGPAGKPLVDRLSGLHGDAEAAAEDRVLRVVRRLCHEYEAPDLWRRIACYVLDLDHLSANDDSTYVPMRAA